MAVKKKYEPHELDENTFFIIIYLIPLVTGLVILLLKGNEDKRIRLHAIQSIILGIVFIVIWIIFGFFGTILLLLVNVLDLLVWLYGIYVGLRAYGGVDTEIPIITDYAKQYSR